MADKFLKLINGEIVQAEADHGNLAGLGDDDHPQYLTEGRGDELYDWLGLASAVMAVHNQTGSHVTNGNSHDHAGGDGGQIDHAQLANKGSNTHAQLDAHFSEGQIYTLIDHGVVFAIGVGANGNLPYFFTLGSEQNPALYARIGISGLQFINNEHNAIPVIIANNGQLTIAPTAAVPPLAIGVNAQGQHVAGLNADIFDWYHSGTWAWNIPAKGLYLRYVNATTVALDVEGIWAIETASPLHGAWGAALTNLQASITTSGAGGRDAGVEAVSTWYYVWYIRKGDGTNALLLSASSTAPTMPSGYIYARRVGAVYNNSSGNFVPFNKRGNLTMWDDQYDNFVIANGKATTWTNVSCATRVSPTATHLYVNSIPVEGDSSQHILKIRPKNLGEGLYAGRTTPGNDSPIQSFPLLNIDRSFDYMWGSAVTNSGFWATIIGYVEDF